MCLEMCSANNIALNALICGIQGVLLKGKLRLIHSLNPAKAFGRIQVNLARQQVAERTALKGIPGRRIASASDGFPD